MEECGRAYVWTTGTQYIHIQHVLYLYVLGAKIMLRTYSAVCYNSVIVVRSICVHMLAMCISMKMTRQFTLLSSVKYVDCGFIKCLFKLLYLGRRPTVCSLSACVILEKQQNIN